MTARSFCMLAAFAIAMPAARALEVTATYRIENLAFAADRKPTDTSFSGGDFPMGFSLGVTDTSQPDLSVQAVYAYDDVLRNILTGLVTYHGNMFSFGVGPFVGFLNTDQPWPKVGVASFFKVEWPGAAFFQLWLDNSTANRLADEGDYLQERNNFSVGFYVPNAICSLNWLNRRFAEQTDTDEVTDTLTEYSFAADIYHKNVPFKIELTFGLQRLARDWEDSAGDTTTQTLYSCILGTRFDMRLSETVSMMIDLDSSIYTWGEDDLLGISNPGTYLFRAVAGVTVDASRLLAPAVAP